MTVTKQKISSENSTFNQLLMELQEECQNVISLVNQLQLAELSDKQKGKILSELLVASIHLYSHCDEDWQNLISDELETLADD
ncbi:hypothetical protein PN471_18335 [Aphanizomenon sp. CS-733/32]|uniref:hypothetical protein n=1 Tax=Aphanizomenon sp. CS-733/32 TaxID=3021715 RepID=UPI00232B24A8|nr:hypothetical protein [Aphanizomenon sp. CS-733/32]MDB9310545.1 hypothetical protein [Aphanizomenon sp. CS-733/32]